MKPFIALLALGAVLVGLCCGLAADAKGIVERHGEDRFGPRPQGLTTVTHLGAR